MSAPMVETTGLSKSFGAVHAVNRVSLTLAPGEILSVLGPSGCGKTTLLRLIAGFEPADEGEVRIQGRSVSEPRHHEPPERRRVGMVFQEYALFPHLTVAENVEFGLKGLASGDRRRRLAELFELVSLQGLDGRYPHELSGGQQQRVALARTLAPRPVVVLLDEPFSNLDATMRTDLRREMEAALRGSGVATVFVTHDREEAFAMADRIAVMREGRIDQVDSPDALFHSPATPFVARIAGTCDFLPGEIRDGRARTELGEVQWTANGHRLPDTTAVTLLVHVDDFQALPDPEGSSSVVSREFRGDGVILSVRLPSGATLRCREHHSSTLAAGSRVTLVPTRAAPFAAFAGSHDA